MFMPSTEVQLSDTQLRVAFDGDAVLFSDESEIIVKQHGLDTFFEHEKQYENKPLAQVTYLCFFFFFLCFISYFYISWRSWNYRKSPVEGKKCPKQQKKLSLKLLLIYFYSFRDRWSVSWRLWGSYRESSTPRTSGWTVPSEPSWSRPAALPAQGLVSWRPSAAGAWRLTKLYSWRAHPKGHCCRKLGRTSSLTTRCSTLREPRSWEPYLPTSPMASDRSTTGGNSSSSLQKRNNRT